jgi:hypothetical protein
MRRRFVPFVFALVLGGLLLASCSSGGARNGQVKLAPISALPKEMQNAPTTVRTAYQFAVANPDALRNVPCYCGCSAIGHKSNLECYVKEFKADGTPVFDDHALGCSICVDIVQDVMKLTAEGKTSAVIRQHIVETYSKFGPANQ